MFSIKQETVALFMSDTGCNAEYPTDITIILIIFYKKRAQWLIYSNQFPHKLLNIKLLRDCLCFVEQRNKGNVSKIFWSVIFAHMHLSKTSGQLLGNL